MKQFRTVNASLWQSAVDQVVARKNAGASPAASVAGPSPAHPARPDQSSPDIVYGNEIAQAIDEGQPVPEATGAVAAAALGESVGFCASAAFHLAEARVKAFFTHDDTELNLLKARLETPFAQCDPRWTEVLEVYAASRIADKTIPYRRHTNPGDFVISNRLPAKATVALLGDWGTGQEGAKQLLVRIAARHPDAVIHLGDVYYSGTKHEVQNYFYSIWQKILGIPKVAWGEKLTDLSKTPATFHLAGNHDMYAGGQPYYSVIDMLGQPASYFCLRNEHWQFLAMDTGLHDSNPSREGDPTWLEDTEVEWLKDKIRNAGGRKTILLSHHQLFTAFEDIGKAPINGKLLSQLQDVLPQVTAWFWGHEHNLVIYGKYLNVLGRCIGHGAFPVQPEELRAPNPDIPLNPVTLAKDTKGFFEHGYVTMELDGADAHVTYYQYDPNSGAETVLFSETL